jgi:hypothetical protein
MSSGDAGSDWHSRMLRAWQLAVLRFAVTSDDADRLAVIAIAGQIDSLGSQQDHKPDFGFFRRTSAELCSAIVQPDELAPAVLRRYVARIDDDRLKRAFAAAIAASQPTVSAIGKSRKRDRSPFRGLPSRGTSRHS